MAPKTFTAKKNRTSRSKTTHIIKNGNKSTVELQLYGSIGTGPDSDKQIHIWIIV